MSSLLASEKDSTLFNQYSLKGHTNVVSVVSQQTLLPIQELIYKATANMLIEHDSSLDIESKLALNFRSPPTPEDFSSLMNTINESSELKDLVNSQEIRNFFEVLFETSDVQPFPISRFRAQYPGIGKSTYGWHQDEGTWYAVKVKDLAYKMPATCWLSVNGADETNSIDIIPESHKTKLEDHYFVEGQGFFDAHVPSELLTVKPFIVKTKPGEGVVFHPLTFHRSRKSPDCTRPRFSIDIRYYSQKREESYRVDWKFKLKRIRALIGI